MATTREHVELYGRVRKVLLSRYFALGTKFRNDFYQESTSLETDESREGIFNKPEAERTRLLWQKRASRDNPWLFGSRLSVALATEARLGLPGADALLGRAIRSCEQLFKFPGVFGGFPLRWDPVTSDSWMDVPGEPGKQVCAQFLISANGRDYLFSTPPDDPRHFPYLVGETGSHLMGGRLYRRYVAARDHHRDTYRFWEPSADEIVGVVTTYVAAAEGTRDTAVRRLTRQRLLRVAEYLAEHGYLAVLPRGGLSVRGSGDALPALQWPFTKAIERATGVDLSDLEMASFQQGLERAGVWDLFRGPTDRAMALAWASLLTGAGAALMATVATILAGWSVTSWTPKFLNPGQIGFTAGIYFARDGFDVSNDEAASGMALAALLHSWGPEQRFLNYIDFVANYTGPERPFSTGFVPYLGFLAIGGGDATTANAYHFWMQKRRDRKVDNDPIQGHSSSCFASVVELLLSQGANTREEARFVRLLDARHDYLAATNEPPIVEPRDIYAGADYLAALALAWRYRQERDATDPGVRTEGFPGLPPGDIVWPEPAVPRSVVEGMADYVPVEAIQGQSPPMYETNSEARLFLPGSPERPAVPRPGLTFGSGDVLLYDERFVVDPGTEVFTGIVLQWGDEWEITADGELAVGGSTLGPDGGADVVWDARFPVHGGRAGGATEHCLVARLNNYTVIGGRRPKERWLYPEETFLYLRLNQVQPQGRGAFIARVRVRGSRRPLRRLLEVGCVMRDHNDPDRRIDAIGGRHRDGTAWRKTLMEALEAQREGVVFFVRQVRTPAVEIVVRQRKGRPYLATLPDRSRRNNLSWRTFPECS